jgi:hypothetical protein
MFHHKGHRALRNKYKMEGGAFKEVYFKMSVICRGQCLYVLVSFHGICNSLTEMIQQETDHGVIDFIASPLKDTLLQHITRKSVDLHPP